MYRYKECNTCQYCDRNGYQDMGFSSDVCNVCVKVDCWGALLDSHRLDDKYQYLHNCPFHSDKMLF